MNTTEGQCVIIVIFGASGDLTARKLIPAFYQLVRHDHLSTNFTILGVSRTDLTDKEFRDKVVHNSSFLEEAKSESDSLQKFAEHIYYQSLKGGYDSSLDVLKERIQGLCDSKKLTPNCLFYLSTPPSLYDKIAQRIHEQDLHKEDDGWKRLIVEKPFGKSLASAKELNKKLLQYFDESQIYRIDHYLGKETVQNLLVTRFSNSIFEPLWNRNYISHVEITNAEFDGVGSRGGYYDTSGALRDMFQNHLLQIVSLTAMEPPVEIEADAIRDEKVKVLRSLRPWTEKSLENQTIRGQYTGAEVKGENLNGYREEKGVEDSSKTETYAAIKFYIDNWRWQGVPFYVRTAKRMPTKVTEVVIYFKSTPHRLFTNSNLNNENVLIIRIQPHEGILMRFGVKIPGQGFQVEPVNMDFYYQDLANTRVPEAYERLLLDAITGDATLYARGDEVEAAWAFVDPILENWHSKNEAKLYGYPAGTWGPENSDDLLEGKHTWRYPCKNLTDSGSYCEL